VQKLLASKKGKGTIYFFVPLRTLSTRKQWAIANLCQAWLVATQYLVAYRRVAPSHGYMKISMHVRVNPASQC